MKYLFRYILLIPFAAIFFVIVNAGYFIWNLKIDKELLSLEFFKGIKEGLEESI